MKGQRTVLARKVVVESVVNALLRALVRLALIQDDANVQLRKFVRLALTNLFKELIHYSSGYPQSMKQRKCSPGSQIDLLSFTPSLSHTISSRPSKANYCDSYFAFPELYLLVWLDGYAPYE